MKAAALASRASMASTNGTAYGSAHAGSARGRAIASGMRSRAR